MGGVTALNPCTRLDCRGRLPVLLSESETLLPLLPPPPPNVLLLRNLQCAVAGVVVVSVVALLAWKRRGKAPQKTVGGLGVSPPLTGRPGCWAWGAGEGGVVGVGRGVWVYGCEGRVWWAWGEGSGCEGRGVWGARGGGGGRGEGVVGAWWVRGGWVRGEGVWWWWWWW